MIDWIAYLLSGTSILVLAFSVWIISLVRNDVSIVDAIWSLMFLLALAVYASFSADPGPRTVLVLVLTAAWAIRLSVYIAWRNHGQPEDYRYQEIRANNEPNFRYKSLYIVFILQASLAWVISLPLISAASGTNPIGLLDYAGICVWLLGFLFEAGGDFQLSRFTQDPANAGKVLDKGLWKLTRHPNYFGNAAIWWGFFLIALSSGGWWTIISPALMTFLLLRVSGVVLMEKDITDRRPAYAHYKRRTNAFFPGLPKS